MSGTICDFPRDTGRARRFLLHVDGDLAGARMPGRLYLSDYGVLGEEVKAGQRWRFKLRMKRRFA